MRIIAVLVLGASCAEAPVDSGDTPDEAPVTITDSTNAACAIPPVQASVPVDPSAPICFDWSALAIEGGFDSINLKYAYILRIAHGLRVTLWKIHTDGLLQSDSNGGGSVDPATGCFDEALDFFFDGECDGESTVLLLLQDTANNVLYIPLDGCTGEVVNPVVLDSWSSPPLEAWFELREVVAAPSGFPTLDWSALTETCWSEPLDPLKVGGLRMIPESGYFDADLYALWAPESAARITATLAMTNAVPLDALRDADGEPFTGFKAGKSWIVALDDVERDLPVWVGRLVVE